MQKLEHVFWVNVRFCKILINCPDASTLDNRTVFCSLAMINTFCSIPIRHSERENFRNVSWKAEKGQCQCTELLFSSAIGAPIPNFLLSCRSEPTFGIKIANIFDVLEGNMSPSKQFELKACRSFLGKLPTLNFSDILYLAYAIPTFRSGRVKFEDAYLIIH